MRLNDRNVTGSSPKLPAGKNETIFFDDDVPGFGLRLRRAGSRAWVYQYWLGDRSRRMTLGKWPKLSAKAARDLVDSLAAKVALGQDPAEDKFEARARHESFGEIATLFLARQAKRLRPRSLVEVERHINLYAKPLHNLTVAKLDRRAVSELLASIATANGAVTANRVRASISAMLNWAMKAGMAEANPAAFTNKEPEGSRSRVLHTDELRQIWTTLPPGDYGTILKLLILTGQRRTEISDLRWSEINAKRGTITLPPERVKNGRQHIIAMSKPVRSLIAATLQQDGRDFLFGYGSTGFAGWSKSKERLDAAINAKRKKPMEPWTVHDLRRTAATMMAEIGIQPHIVEATLNHASGHKGGIAGVYNHARYESEVRQALTHWGEHVLEIVGEGAGTKRRKSGRAS
jgi:integrase